jgi:diguanylate cyclase (GGDEF)-like protein
MRLFSPPAARTGRRGRAPRLGGPIAAGLAAAAVLVTAAVAIIALQHISDERRVQQLLLVELEASAAEQRQLGLRALAAGSVDEGLARTIRSHHRRLDLLAATVGRASAHDPALAQVADQVAAYRQSTDRVLGSLRTGQKMQAERIDRDAAERAYATLIRLTGEAQANAGRRAEDAAALVRAGTLGVLGLASMLLILIMLRLERARRAAHEALYDPLTGLANRMLFGDRLRHALAVADRRRETLVVLFVDLDDFKTVNDSLGHAAGDELLTRTAERVVTAARSSDTVARLGGDEFAFLLERTSEEGAERFASRLVEALGEPIQVGGRTVTMNATVGCAVSLPGETDADELLRNADLALYAGKRKGRGCFVTYEPSMYQALADRLDLEEDLRGAVERGEIGVLYQPIVEVGSRRLTAVEALARWNHPTRGVVPPSLFIPIAEETGVIRDIGTHVLEVACAQARRWHDERPGERPVGVTVNVSPVQLQRDELVADVRRVLELTGLDAHLLTLEITESVLVERGDTFVDELEELSALGVRLAVDDFGTGYSSLSSLSRFPVDVLKIDRAFVVDVGSDLDGQALVRSIVDLGRSLGLEAVAEGVEQSDQAAALQDVGCDLGQGFHFARPMDADAIGDLLGITPQAEQGSQASGKGRPAALRPQQGRLSAA